jgi:inorganic triphosphatase YgiF
MRPDLDLPGGGRVEAGAQSLDSVYYDTDLRDLLTHGVTLRYRTVSGGHPAGR